LIRVQTDRSGTILATATLKSWLPTGAWSAGGNLNTARYGLAGAGTQTAALAFGGIQVHQIQLQQKHTMVLLGQTVAI
jgi:hypothetical protein